jgi:glycyl-tRNA synthetase beta subunit
MYEFDEEIIQDIYDFIVSRLEMYYQEQAIDKAVVRAVLAKTIEFITKMKAPLGMIHNAEKFQ